MHRILLFMAGVWLAIGTSGAAYAACRSPNDVCHHIKYCATAGGERNDYDQRRLNDAIAAGNGHEVYAASEACQRNVGRIRDWERDSAGCTSDEFLWIARTSRDSGWSCGGRVRWYCVDRGNRNQVLGDLDSGICNGPKTEGAICICAAGRAGQVIKHEF